MKPLEVGENVWKQGNDAGAYEGPGVIVAAFKNWAGQLRFVVGHRVEGGRGWFYHIYGPKQLTRDRADRSNEP